MSLRGGVRTYYGIRDLSVGAFSFETPPLVAGTNVIAAGQLAPSTIRRVNMILLRADAPISQTVTIWYVSPLGVLFDTVLVSCVLSGAQNFAYLPEADIMLPPTAGIRLVCTSTGAPAITVRGQIALEEW